MSQDIFNDINPSTTSGTQLASILNLFKDAIASGFSGTSRPANLQAGGSWVDTTNDPTGWTVFLYDGTQDIELFTLDLVEGKANISGGGDLLELLKASDNDLPPVLKFLKKRVSGNGQSEDGDILGQVEVYGTDSGGVERRHALLKVESTDDTSVTSLGSFLSLELANEGTGSLVEVLRVIDKKLGIGEINPQNTIHVKSTDGAIRAEKNEDSANAAQMILEKKRLAGNGQALLSDNLGKFQVDSADQNGTQFEAAKIEISASENHTDLARGTDFKIFTISEGDTSLVERFSIEDGKVIIPDLKAGATTFSSITSVKESDDADPATIIARKSRIAGSGQVLENDNIGKVSFESTDVDGDIFESSSIESQALEDATNTGKGTKLTFKSIGTGETTLSDRLVLDETSNFPGNLQIGGNLTVNGTTTTVNSTELDVTDSNISVNVGGDQSSADTNGAGLTVEMTDAADASFSYDSSLESKFKIGEVGSESEVVTVSDTQTLTNKTSTSQVLNTPDINDADMDGGTATEVSIEDPSRLDAKKDTLANLETYASTASDGQFCYATDIKAMFQVKDNALAPIAGGLGGNDVYFQEDFEQVQASDFLKGSGTFLSGGSFTITVANNTTTPLEGSRSIRFTSLTGGADDYAAHPDTIDIERFARGKNNTAVFYTQGTFATGDWAPVLWDATNSKEIQGSVEFNNTLKRFDFRFFMPSDCEELRWGMRSLVDNDSTYIDLDKIEFNASGFYFTNIRNSTKLIDKGATNIEAVTTNPTKGTTVRDKRFEQRDGSMLRIRLEYEQSSAGTAGSGLYLVPIGEGRKVDLTAVNENTGNTEQDRAQSIVGYGAAYGAGQTQGTMRFRVYDEDYLVASIHRDGNAGMGDWNNTLADFGNGSLSFSADIEIQIDGWEEESEAVASNAIAGSNYGSYTPDLTGFGTPTNVDFKYYQTLHGTYVIFGKFTSGTSTAVEAQVSLPNGKTVKTGEPLRSVGYGVNANSTDVQKTVLATSGDSFINFGIQSGSRSGLTVVNASEILASGQTFSFSCEVPIEGLDAGNSITVISPLIKTCKIYESQTSGTEGGTFTSGSYVTRTLNVIDDNSGRVSLNSNQFTIQPGEYNIYAEAPASSVDRHRCQVVNVADSGDYIQGRNAYNPSNTQGVSTAKGFRKITTPTTYSLGHRCQTTKTTDGLGIACSFGDEEIYSQVFIEVLK